MLYHSPNSSYRAQHEKRERWNRFFRVALGSAGAVMLACALLLVVSSTQSHDSRRGLGSNEVCSPRSDQTCSAPSVDTIQKQVAEDQSEEEKSYVPRRKMETQQLAENHPAKKLAKTLMESQLRTTDPRRTKFNKKRRNAIFATTSPYSMQMLATTHAPRTNDDRRKAMCVTLPRSLPKKASTTTRSMPKYLSKNLANKKAYDERKKEAADRRTAASKIATLMRNNPVEKPMPNTSFTEDDVNNWRPNGMKSRPKRIFRRRRKRNRKVQKKD